MYFNLGFGSKETFSERDAFLCATARALLERLLNGVGRSIPTEEEVSKIAAVAVQLADELEIK